MEDIFTIDELRKSIKGLSYDEQIEFIFKRKAEYCQSLPNYLPVFSAFGMNFDRQCDIEIEAIERTNKLKNPHLTNTTSGEKQVLDKIDWKTNERLIPYLFKLLNDAGFINVNHPFATIAKHFTVNGKTIKRVNLKSNYNESDIENIAPSKIPIDAKKILEIKTKLKELNQILISLE